MKPNIVISSKIETTEGQSNMDSDTPVAYLGIIDIVGRRLYSGNITWLREYLQNAIDAGATEIKISIHGTDLEISDNGRGMDKADLMRQAFSLGRSFKETKEIGELGIGIYAGSGTCNKIVVLTKKENKGLFEGTLDMLRFEEIINNKPETTFEGGMRQIFSIVNVSNDKLDFSEKEHFTRLRFESMNRDTIQLLNQTDLKIFIEETVDLPVHSSFPHKLILEQFLGNDKLNVEVSLDKDGTREVLRKFDPGSVSLTDTFWSKEVAGYDDNGVKIPIAKIWACYNKSGESLERARILVKRKGLIVGDATYVRSRFEAKYSPRFFGEIVLLSDEVEINTSRDWFLPGPALEDFKLRTRDLLNELYGIADFDSKNGVRILHLIQSNKKLEKQLKVSQEKGNFGLAAEKIEQIKNNASKIEEKILEAETFKERVNAGELDLSDPTNKMKEELIDRTLADPDVDKTRAEIHKGKPESAVRRRRQSPFPAMVRTFLTQNVVDRELAERIGNGDMRDTTSRAFSFIEQKLKEKVGKRPNERCDWRIELIPLFKKLYDPPDYDGFSMPDHKEAFTQVMNGLYTFLRNPSDHTFMDDMNQLRNVFEILLVADFLVNWIDRWSKI